MRLLGSICVIMASLISCNKEHSTVFPPPPNEGTILGKVVSHMSGLAVSGATVRIDSLTNRIKITDTQGQYIFSGVPSGTYTIAISASNFDSISVNATVMMGVITNRSDTLAYVIPDSLVASYVFNGNANDESGNNRDGIVSGATLSSNRFNVPSRAYHFDGLNDLIILPDSLIQGSVTESISLWFRTTQEGGIIGYQAASYPDTINPNQPYNHVPVVYVGTDRRIHAQLWIGFVNLISSTDSVTDNTWHHLVLTSGPTSQNLYLDGSLVGSIGGFVNHLAMIKNQVGSVQARGGYPVYNPWPLANLTDWFPFNGYVDDVRIWHKRLSIGEINQLLNER